MFLRGATADRVRLASLRSFFAPVRPARVMQACERVLVEVEVAPRPVELPLEGGPEDAGIVRERVYVTNAGKHFKFTQRGKRRLHDKPNAGEIDVCRWWVEGERELIQPKLVLALGASAARGMLGKTVSVQKMRGVPHRLDDGAELWVTIHPSYLLRLKDERKLVEDKLFAEDLRKVAARLGT